MPRNPRAAVVSVRMAPQLKLALVKTAESSGCSLNAFAVQVLAAAAGGDARFSPTAEAGPITAPARRDLQRDERGFPLDWRERFAHVAARQDFFFVTEREIGARAAGALMRRYDRDDPAFFVEWAELRRNREPEDRAPASRPAAG